MPYNFVEDEPADAETLWNVEFDGLTPAELSAFFGWRAAEFDGLTAAESLVFFAWPCAESFAGSLATGGVDATVGCAACSAFFT